ncbi:MAG: thiamine biosynthesis protein [Proteobacteria bacterium]|nr:thiamine biosynthesis protein [Pseudomonadota bacterium]MBU1709770.1 thiamine biosynthesis protein [Pseudomonadota bacterium]
MHKDPVGALALFSGGLDSILSCRLTMSLGIKVTAIRFVTPFFGYELLKNEKAYRAGVKEKYGIDVRLHDVSEPYLKLLRDPAHGYGKNFNPCLDCKIFLVSEARKLMPRYQASFIITGEVVGQRPMSQRKDTLRVVERDSGCDGILVRPLCAKNMMPTRVEEDGLVDRERLLGFSGRGRSDQIRLAAEFGITDYPRPGGGCVLTDPILSKRIESYYNDHEIVMVENVRLLQAGRQFQLPGGGWLVMGRDAAENKKVKELRQPGDLVLKMKSRPGPTAILRFGDDPDDRKLAAGLVVRYGRKVKKANKEARVILTQGREKSEIIASPLDDVII